MNRIGKIVRYLLVALGGATLVAWCYLVLSSTTLDLSKPDGPREFADTGQTSGRATAGNGRVALPGTLQATSNDAELPRVYVLEEDVPRFPNLLRYDWVIQRGDVGQVFQPDAQPERRALIVSADFFSNTVPPPNQGTPGNANYEALMTVVHHGHMLYVLDNDSDEIATRLNLKDRPADFDPVGRRLPVMGLLTGTQSADLETTQSAGIGFYFNYDADPKSPADGFFVLDVRGPKEATLAIDASDVEYAEQLGETLTVTRVLAPAQPPYQAIYGELYRLIDPDSSETNDQDNDQSGCELTVGLPEYRKQLDWRTAVFNYPIFRRQYGRSQADRLYDGWPICCPMGRIEYWVRAFGPSYCPAPDDPDPDKWLGLACNQISTSGSNTAKHPLFKHNFETMRDNWNEILNGIGGRGIPGNPANFDGGLPCVIWHASAPRGENRAERPGDGDFNCAQRDDGWMAYQKAEVEFTPQQSYRRTQDFDPNADSPAAAAERQFAVEVYANIDRWMQVGGSFPVAETLHRGIERRIFENGGVAVWTYTDPGLLEWIRPQPFPVYHAPRSVMCDRPPKPWAICNDLFGHVTCRSVAPNNEASGSRQNVWKQAIIWEFKGAFANVDYVGYSDEAMLVEPNERCPGVSEPDTINDHCPGMNQSQCGPDFLRWFTIYRQLRECPDSVASSGPPAPDTASACPTPKPTATLCPNCSPSIQPPGSAPLPTPTLPCHPPQPSATPKPTVPASPTPANGGAAPVP